MWIVWAPNGTGEGAELRAYDPIPVNGEPVLRWSAPIGTSAKFALPGVGAGRLYVGTRDGHVLGVRLARHTRARRLDDRVPDDDRRRLLRRTLTLTATEALTLSTPRLELLPVHARHAVQPRCPRRSRNGQTIEVPITFTPTGTGPIGATLTATTSTGYQGHVRTLRNRSDGGPEARSIAAVVTFGGTSVGEEPWPRARRSATSAARR